MDWNFCPTTGFNCGDHSGITNTIHKTKEKTSQNLLSLHDTNRTLQLKNSALE